MIITWPCPAQWGSSPSLHHAQMLSTLLPHCQPQQGPLLFPPLKKHPLFLPRPFTIASTEKGTDFPWSWLLPPSPLTSAPPTPPGGRLNKREGELGSNPCAPSTSSKGRDGEGLGSKEALMASAPASLTPGHPTTVLCSLPPTDRGAFLGCGQSSCRSHPCLHRLRISIREDLPDERARRGFPLQSSRAHS